MTEKTSFLHSGYVIDGISMNLTPARMLDECLADPPGECNGNGPFEPIVDETVDLAPSTFVFKEQEIGAYLDMTLALCDGKRTFPLPFAGPVSCAKIARALIDSIWMSGHFRLGDLLLRMEWRWDGRPIGNMAAFYDSVQGAAGYIDALGLKLRSYSVHKGTCSLSVRASTAVEEDPSGEEEEDEEIIIRELPFRTHRPRMGRKRKCPGTLVGEASDWLIYIPFDPCDFRLGGSLLAEATDSRSAVAPEIADADYFIDCFEVVRELVEDGVVKAGVTVGEGGLLTALRRMSVPGTGADISIYPVIKAYSDEKPVRILFSEVPGVILQIADIDYDYVDAELLLQDIAYFPIGHPAPGKDEIRVSTDAAAGISGILESLLQTQTSEGED